MIASIVIPTYRRPHLLFRCLKALLQQKFDRSEYEIIVVSDGPDEQTQQLFNGLAGYSFPALRLLQMPHKKGPAAARNFGWLNAKGAIIAFTDDDCVPDMHWLDQMVSNCHPDEDVALTGKVVVPLENGRPTDYELNTANLQTAEFITANCCCTKKALIKAGGFDEQFSMAWREDSDLEFKLIDNQIPIKRIESALVTHPVRDAAWGVSVKEQKKTMYDALLFKKNPYLFRKKIRKVTPVLYYTIISFFVVMGCGLLSRNNPIIVTGAAGWVALTAYFIYKRLSVTKLSATHIAEMVVTSFIIPFVSVYWQWRGALKYRVLFI